MRQEVLLAIAITLQISTGCSEALTSKPKVVSKRTNLGATASDATARNSGTIPIPGSIDGASVPGTANPGIPTPTDPTGTPTGSGVTPPPVDTGSGQVITVENGCYKGDAFLCQIEISIANKTNIYRGSLGRISYSAGMAWVSRDWSKQQAAQNSLGHQGFPAARYSKYSGEFSANAPVSFAAENVAYAFGTSTSPDDIAEELMTLWITSSGHRDNILGNFKSFGVGVAKTGNYYYATQNFGK